METFNMCLPLRIYVSLSVIVQTEELMLAKFQDKNLFLSYFRKIFFFQIACHWGEPLNSKYLLYIKNLKSCDNTFR